MKTTVLGLSWANDKPYLRVRNGDEPVSELVELGGFVLNYEADASTPRHCLGHVPFRQGRGSYHDCLKAPQAGSRTCERCSIVEATFASNLHHAHTRGSAELDPAIREHLQQPNRLYLAAFRDGSVKVGTSTQRRSQQRLVEQGAWMARYVAIADDGYAVRDLEDRVTSELGVAQAVNATRKVRGLVTPVADERLGQLLDDLAQQVVELVQSDTGRVAPFDEAWRNPNADHPALQKLYAYPAKLVAGAHDLELVTAIGRTAIAVRPGTTDAFAIDVGPLFGIELDIGGAVSDEITIQDSLF